MMSLVYIYILRMYSRVFLDNIPLDVATEKKNIFMSLINSRTKGGSKRC